MLNLYILFQLVFLILIVIFKMNINSIFLLNIFKILPIILNLLFSFTKKINSKLRLALFFKMIADLSFLFMNNCVLGISFFFIDTTYILFIYK